MVELDHQRSSAKTSVNKMGLDIFVLFNIFNFLSFENYENISQLQKSKAVQKGHLLKLEIVETET